MPLILTNDNLMTLLANPAIRAAFSPFLNTWNVLQNRQRAGGCARCGRAKAGPNFDGLRAYIAGLPDQSKARLKSLAGADTVVVSYKAGNQVNTITF